LVSPERADSCLPTKGMNIFVRSIVAQVTALTPWSPLKGHVIEGDVLTAIDGAKVANVPFEQVRIAH